MSTPLLRLIALPFTFDDAHRLPKELFLNNLTYNSTDPLSLLRRFYTSCLIREHHDYYPYYRDNHSSTETQGQPPLFYLLLIALSIRLNQYTKTSIFALSTHPLLKFSLLFLINFPKVTSSYPNIFSLLLLFKQSSEGTLFDLHNIEQLPTIEDNPYHWLQSDINRFHLYRCSEPQNRIFSLIEKLSYIPTN